MKKNTVLVLVLILFLGTGILYAYEENSRTDLSKDELLDKVELLEVKVNKLGSKNEISKGINGDLTANYASHLENVLYQYEKFIKEKEDRIKELEKKVSSNSDIIIELKTYKHMFYILISLVIFGFLLGGKSIKDAKKSIESECEEKIIEEISKLTNKRVNALRELIEKVEQDKKVYKNNKLGIISKTLEKSEKLQGYLSSYEKSYPLMTNGIIEGADNILYDGIIINNKEGAISEEESFQIIEEFKNCKVLYYGKKLNREHPVYKENEDRINFSNSKSTIKRQLYDLLNS
ncbi:NARF domain-containing protein [Dethiothermospora halolimnae]|uniref:NARF domain-containing protein n=1 Tax=Dethiothermospora halolimnae TaxID=3114390 RepID=UPI003CCC3EC6